MKCAFIAMAALAMTAAACETSTVAPAAAPAIDGVWKGTPPKCVPDPKDGEITLTLKAHPGGAVDATFEQYRLRGEFKGPAQFPAPLKGVFSNETYRIEFRVDVEKMPPGGVNIPQGIIMFAAVERDLSAINILATSSEENCVPVRLTRR
jgi:hypothetical protein